jgi:hypothetical protein
MLLDKILINVNFYKRSDVDDGTIGHSVLILAWAIDPLVTTKKGGKQGREGYT